MLPKILYNYDILKLLWENMIVQVFKYSFIFFKYFYTLKVYYKPKAALMPPCAATVWDLVGKSLVTTAVLKPSCTKPKAALRPAPPAPMTRASCLWSIMVYDCDAFEFTDASFSGDAPPTDRWRFLYK